MHFCTLAGLGVAAMVSIATLSPGQRVADPDFNTRVTQPAYTSDGPRVLFDEAHHNIHTASGLYKPFADLITSDGYRVTPNRSATPCATGLQRATRCCSSSITRRWEPPMKALLGASAST